MPEKQAEDVQDIDADPNEKISDGGQHKELLKDEIIHGQHQSLPHG